MTITIHQLEDRCGDPRPPLDDERERHYDTEAEALADLKEARDDADDAEAHPGTKAVQTDGPCWLVRCDGDCEQAIDEEDECYIVHCESRQAAEDLAATWKWAYSADGRLVFCESDAPDGGEALPPTPAELEAAGQMRLPGVA